MRHRPIGIGVQGFADLLMQLRLPFESKGAIELNREIFETIYFAAVTMSCEMAEVDGPYQVSKNEEFLYQKRGMFVSKTMNFSDL